MKALHTSYKKQFVNKKYRHVFVADGFTSIMIYGEVKLNIILGDMPTSINAFIVKDLCASCILGMDFINRYKLIINMRERTVSVYNHSKRITLKINCSKGYTSLYQLGQLIIFEFHLNILFQFLLQLN